MQTTFEQLLTPYQQQQAVDFIAQANRVAAAVHGAQQKGMDVPDLEVLCSPQVWAEPSGWEETVDMLVTIEGGFARTFTAVHRPGRWPRPQHFTKRLHGIADDTVYFAPDWLSSPGPVRRLSWADSTLALTTTDPAHLERAYAIGYAWISHLSHWLEAVLDIPYMGLLQPGVGAADGSLYVADEALQFEIYRASGEVLDVGWGLSALKDPDAADLDGYALYTEADQATAARLQQLQGAGA